ncbi:MAG TPA: cupredoxin domain-containing protein [Solirubrobacteraceae bacterium]|nr:cupredoxin domain-containing protein [Solirubrobacteraceae bacterium]
MRKLLPLLLLCLAAAGCGGGKSTPAATPTPTSAPAAAVVPVVMRNIKFVPARVTVKVGQTVRWTNDDKVAHTVASAKLKVASEAIGHGQTYELKATKPGTFPYYCTIHANQNGVLVVTPR